MFSKNKIIWRTPPLWKGHDCIISRLCSCGHASSLWTVLHGSTYMQVMLWNALEIHRPSNSMFLVQTLFDRIPLLCAHILSHVHTPEACFLLSGHRTNNTIVNYVIKTKKKSLCTAAALPMTLAKPLAWNPSIVLISSRNVSAVICIFAFLDNPLLIITNTMLTYCILGFLSL